MGASCLRSFVDVAEPAIGITGSTKSRRPLRARITVSQLDERRTGTGDSARSQKSQNSCSIAGNGGRPIWLQHDVSVLPLSRCRDSQHGTDLSSRAENSVRKSGKVRVANVEEPGQTRSVGDGPRSFEEGPQNINHLQQQIQKLNKQLKEAETLSAQGDGLPTFMLDEVEFGYQIAQGGFSSVYSATWHGTPCAVKKIFDPVLTEELRAEFENEVRMLRRLRHPNVVTLMAVCRKPPALSILTEYVAGGSMFQLLHGAAIYRTTRDPSREPATLIPILLQVAVGIAFLHSMLVIHRDVKSHNVLLTTGTNPCVKLCDFGLARMKSELCTGTMQWAGTAAYMAPELFAKKRYTESVDVFAFGVLLWEAVAVEIPHANLEAPDIAHRVQQGDCGGLAITCSWPKSLKRLLRATLAVQSDRPSMVDVLAQLRDVLLDFTTSQ